MKLPPVLAEKVVPTDSADRAERDRSFLIFAGIVLGWAIGACVHLAFGSPGGRPSVVQVGRTLLELGVDVRDLRRSDFQPVGATLMDAEDDEGRLRIKVIGRDEADAQFVRAL